MIVPIGELAGVVSLQVLEAVFAAGDRSCWRACWNRSGSFLGAVFAAFGDRFSPVEILTKNKLVLEAVFAASIRSVRHRVPKIQPLGPKAG